MLGLKRQEAPVLRSERVPPEIRLPYLLGVVLLFPVVAITRLSSGRRERHRGESVFTETNRSVLTALGVAFMA
jgi:hypothetical protein